MTRKQSFLVLFSFVCIAFFVVSHVRARQAIDSVDETKSLELLVEALNSTNDSAIQTALMRGMLSGLEGRRNVSPPKSWSDLSKKLVDSDDRLVRDLSNQLSQIFGDRSAMTKALAVLQDPSATSNDRRKALRSLMALQSEEASALLESLLDEPGLRLDAIRGYAMVENPVAPSVLLGRYQQFNPEHQRAVIETLATRKPYAIVLFAAIKNNKISRDDIPVHVARSLKGILGNRFVQVFGEVKSIGADREKQMAKYKKMLTPATLANADASRGRAVFKKTCASCHLLYGEGGKVGPDLTGSNRANLDYILLNSVDPSYDVPDGYKMVTVVTIDGRLINGVVAEEDGTKLVLKTAEQPRVVIAKEDIEQRKVSPKSMMPDGQLDQMEKQQVIDLIKYLRTTEQVEIAK
jgi:putative heme-binding domain-containing protein